MIVEKLGKTTNRLLFQNLSFRIDKGLLLLSGPSGCGKSTLVRILMGRIPSESGTVEGVSSYAYAGQGKSVFDQFSLRDNLSILAMTEHDKRRAQELIAAFSFQNLSEKKIRLLSGGERRKAALILALCQDRDIYFLDEPFSSLDETGKKTLLEEINRIRSERLVVLVNHDESVKIDSADVELSFLGGGRVDVLDRRKAIKEERKVGRNKGTKDSSLVFPFFRSLVLDNRLMSFIDGILLAVAAVLFAIGCSFFNGKSEFQNALVSLAYDPFPVQRYVASSLEACDESIFSLPDSRMEIILSTESMQRLLVVETNDSDGAKLWVKGKDEFPNLVLDGKRPDVVSEEDIIENNDLDYLLATFRDRGSASGVEAVLFLSRPEMDTILFSNLALIQNLGDPFLPIPGLVSANGVLRLSYSGVQSATFRLVDEPGFFLAVPSYTETEIDICDETNNVLMTAPVEESDGDEVMMSVEAYKNFLLHVPSQTGKVYAIALSKEVFRSLGEKGGITPLDVIACPSNAGFSKSILFLSLSVFSFFLLFLFLLLTMRVRRKWLSSMQDVLCAFGTRMKATNLYFSGQMAFLLVLVLLSLLLYLAVFLPMANRMNALATMPPRIDGFFYYSQQPLNDYYDGITTFLPFQRFEPAFLFVLALFLYPLFSLFLLRKKKGKY